MNATGRFSNTAHFGIPQKRERLIFNRRRQGKYAQISFTKLPI